jgi:excisionase family DNA binding protein
VNLADLPPVLTVEEFAAAMRLSRGSAYDFVRQGGVRHVRCGRSIRIPRSAVLELLGEPPETLEPRLSGLKGSSGVDVDGNGTAAR